MSVVFFYPTRCQHNTSTGPKSSALTIPSDVCPPEVCVTAEVRSQKDTFKIDVLILTQNISTFHLESMHLVNIHHPWKENTWNNTWKWLCWLTRDKCIALCERKAHRVSCTNEEYLSNDSLHFRSIEIINIGNYTFCLDFNKNKNSKWRYANTS